MLNQQLKLLIINIFQLNNSQIIQIMNKIIKRIKLWLKLIPINQK